MRGRPPDSKAVWSARPVISGSRFFISCGDEDSDDSTTASTGDLLDSEDFGAVGDVSDDVVFVYHTESAIADHHVTNWWPIIVALGMALFAFGL